MATKKQMTDTINRVDIIEDNMLKMEEHIGLLKEIIMIQNKHIEQMNTFVNQIITDKREKKLNNNKPQLLHVNEVETVELVSPSKINPQKGSTMPMVRRII